MKSHCELDEIYFPLPAFALMGNLRFGQHFSRRAIAATNSTFVISIANTNASLTKELFVSHRTIANSKCHIIIPNHK